MVTLESVGILGLKNTGRYMLRGLVDAINRVGREKLEIFIDLSTKVFPLGLVVIECVR